MPGEVIVHRLIVGWWKACTAFYTIVLGLSLGGGGKGHLVIKHKQNMNFAEISHLYLCPLCKCNKAPSESQQRRAELLLLYPKQILLWRHVGE